MQPFSRLETFCEKLCQNNLRLGPVSSAVARQQHNRFFSLGNLHFLFFRKEKKGQKGIFFSIMAMMLALLVISAAQILSEDKAYFEKSGAKMAALKISSSLLRSISSSLGNYEENPAINQRDFPFEYSIDANRIFIKSEIPLNQAKIDGFFDFLNAYGIFLTDQDYNNSYSGFAIDLNVPRNSYWQGTEKGISFSFSPLCIKYSVLDANNFSFAEGNGCDFNQSAIRVMDLNIGIPPGLGHDFNSLSCSLQGYSGCPQEDFNSLDERPYFRLIVDDANCQSCGLLQKTAGFHVNSAGENSIVLSCIGPGCNSSAVAIGLSPLPGIANNGGYVLAEFGINSVAAVDEFYFDDYNASVRALIYGAESVK